MAKITCINKVTIATFREAVEKNLKEFGEERGLAISTGKARYDDSFVKLEVTFALISKDGTVETPEKQDLIRYGEMHGLKAKYGDLLLFKGDYYHVIGLCVNRSKYPVLVKHDLHGKKSLLTVQSANSSLIKINPSNPCPICNRSDENHMHDLLHKEALV